MEPPTPPHDDPTPLLYTELAAWYPLLTPVEDYAEEAAFYRAAFAAHARRPLRTLLDLGCGAGHNAAHLKATFACTLVDRAPAMLDLSRRLNPECEHVRGDIRSLRLGRRFDAVLLHDAVCYMTTRADLARAFATAQEHTAPGGVLLVQPDFVAETFEPGTECGGSDGSDGRALRYLEWRRPAAPPAEAYVSDMAYLLRREDGTVEVRHDRHRAGLFPRGAWMEALAAAGFEPRILPFDHGGTCAGAREVFVGLRPPDREGA